MSDFAARINARRIALSSRLPSRHHPDATVRLERGDCHSLVKAIPSGTVDLIFVDPPYGITECGWDQPLRWGDLWPEIERVLRPAGTCLIMGTNPFSAHLIAGAPKGFYRHNWTWIKNRASGHLKTRVQPLRVTEDVMVFGRMVLNETRTAKHPSFVYHPQMIARDRAVALKQNNKSSRLYKATDWWKEKRELTTRIATHRYPTNIVEFDIERNHLVPTQKPIPLIEYFLRTYSNSGQTILDFCMGTGSTGVACSNLGRSFVGFEMAPEHFRIAKRRIEKAGIEGSGTARPRRLGSSSPPSP